MLTSLRISNFALIDHLELVFDRGLNILTGETGAGKSIIIDALGIALGERASTDMLRSESQRLTVEATFSLHDAADSTQGRLIEYSLENEDDPDTLIMSRELNSTGKSQSRINGRLVTTLLLRQVGQDLVDVHGQHEHQSLLNAETHIDLFDNWLGSEALTLRKSISAKYTELSQVRRDLEKLTSDSRERVRNADLYSFQLKEITEAGLSSNELDQLTSERARLNNSERLKEAAEESYSSMSSDVIDTVNKHLFTLTKAAEIDPGLASVVEQLTEASAYIEESITLLRRYRETLEIEPGRLEAINERLDLIHSLQRKYGETVDEVIEYARSLEKKLFDLEDNDAREAELQKQRHSIELSLDTLSANLSKKRADGAKVFSAAILSELADLAMGQSRFEVAISRQDLNPKGFDRIEFLISTNPGAPLRPLAKIASGGETSRLMLAIKSVLAKSSYVPTMIFDEIDSGIGGRTGRILADKLASLGTQSQILCITHLPQIASRPAAKHFSIEKTVINDRTSIAVTPLGKHEREVEIARMLGGDNTETVLLHAREMLAAR